MDNKFLKKDPADTDMGISFIALQTAMKKLELIAKALLQVDKETICLSVQDKGSQPRRLLDPMLDQVIDEKMADAITPILQELANDLIRELESNGITINDDVISTLLPNVSD